MHGDLDAQADEYREVGGTLVSGLIVDSRTTHVEVLARQALGPISWRFRQPRLALFWFRSGFKELHLELGGQRIDSKINERTNLALLPPSTSIEGEFEVASHFDYTVVFLDPTVAKCSPWAKVLKGG
jgi:AraC family transcriptional regulator